MFLSYNACNTLKSISVSTSCVYSVIKANILSPCNHKFHTSCIIESLRRNGPKCPLCRGLPSQGVTSTNQGSSALNSNYVNNYHVDWNYDPLDVQDIAGNYVFS